MGSVLEKTKLQASNDFFVARRNVIACYDHDGNPDSSFDFNAYRSE